MKEITHDLILYCTQNPLWMPEIRSVFRIFGIYNFEQHQERQHTKRTHKKRSQDGEKVAPSIIMTSINVPTMDAAAAASLLFTIEEASRHAQY